MPCNYNQIIVPGVGEVMPFDLYLATDGVASSTWMTHYKDSVSLRCSNPYTDLCGSNVYSLEKADGSPMPAGVNLNFVWNAASGTY